MGVDKDIDNERLVCMKRACEEARLREEAVEVYEQRQLVKADSIPPLIPHTKNSIALASESRIPPLPKQKGALSPSSSGSSMQNSRFPAAYANILCSGSSRIPAAPAPPPVASY